jgi:spore coat protein U-like protein
MKYHLLSGAAGLSLLCAPIHSAFAATAVGSFNVTIVITSECKVQSTANVDFGSEGVIDANVDAAGSVGVQCTKNTTYNIGLSAGSGAGATVAARKMTGPASETVTYSLYRDAGHSQVWGTTIGTDTISGTGTGASQSYPVYGRVQAQTTPPPGTYTDTITVTVTY